VGDSEKQDLIRRYRACQRDACQARLEPADANGSHGRMQTSYNSDVKNIMSVPEHAIQVLLTTWYYYDLLPKKEILHVADHTITCQNNHHSLCGYIMSRAQLHKEVEEAYRIQSDAAVHVCRRPLDFLTFINSHRIPGSNQRHVHRCRSRHHIPSHLASVSTSNTVIQSLCCFWMCVLVNPGLFNMFLRH